MTRPGVAQPLLARALVARQAELAALLRAVEDLQAGRGAALALLGERGVGKSRLLAEIDRRVAAAGMPVLRGRAVPDGRTPYRPLAEAFAPLVQEAVAEPVPIAVRAGLQALAPHLFPDAAPALHVTPLVVAEALRSLLAARPAREAGVAILLEDVHWADPETLEAIEALAERAPGDRLLLVVAARDDEPSPALALVRRMRERRAVLLLTLHRLPPPDALALAADALGSAPPAALVPALRRADGLPFLVEEILTSLAVSGALRPSPAGWQVVGEVGVVPAVVRDLVEERVAELGEQARRLLEAAAVVGDLRDGVPAAAAGLPLHAVPAATAELVGLGLLRQERGGAGFRHALVRQALLDLLSPEEGASLARRALQALESLDPGLGDGRLDRAVELAERAGDRASAARLLLVAGRRALAAGALLSAEKALRAARPVASSDTRIEVDELLTRVLAEAGLVDDCEEVALALLHALDVTHAPAGRVLAVRLRLARLAVAAGREAEPQLAAAEQLLRVVDEETARSCVTTLDLLRAQSALAADDLGSAAAAATSARRGPPDVASAAWLVLGRCARVTDPAAARDAFSRALAIAEAADLPVERLRALGELGTVDLLATGPRDRLEQALALALDSGALATAVAVQTQLAWWWEDRGSGEDVVRHAAAAAALAERLGAPVPAAMARTAEAVGRALSGDVAAADRALALATEHAADDPDVLAAADGHARTLLALRDDDRGLALARLRRATGWLAGRPHPDPMPMWGLWALLEAVSGDDGERAVAHVRALGLDVHVMIRGYLHLADGVLSGRAGDRQQAASDVEAGRRRLTGLQPFHALAMRHVAGAALADGWGVPASWLTAALPELERHGFLAPASAARSLLRQAGVTPTRSRLGDGVPAAWVALGVTAREADVLTLLAAGEPTRRIAQRLYLSVKTVERHTANLAAKAGVSGRAQLVAFASRSLAEDGGSPDVARSSSGRG